MYNFANLVLYRMINEPTTNFLIHWSFNGETFVVTKPEEFAKEILPKYFKHNNFSSFVRQLNMYGFHKVPHLQQGVMQSDGAEDTSWEFVHNYFQRDRIDLLVLVKRKESSSSTSSSAPTSSGAAAAGTMRHGSPLYADTQQGALIAAPGSSFMQNSSLLEGNVHPEAVSGSTLLPGGNCPSSPSIFDISTLLREVSAIKRQQDHISDQLSQIENEHSLLWHETLAARERYMQQQDVMDRVLRFLAGIFSSDKLTKEAASIVEALRKGGMSSGANFASFFGASAVAAPNHALSPPLSSPWLPDITQNGRKRRLITMPEASLDSKAPLSMSGKEGLFGGRDPLLSSTMNPVSSVAEVSDSPPLKEGSSSSAYSNNIADGPPKDPNIETVKETTEHLENDIDNLQLDLEELTHTLGLDDIINLSGL